MIRLRLLAPAILIVLCGEFPAGAQQRATCPCAVKGRPVRKQVNADLEMAKTYVKLQNWPDAEAHFVLAVKDPNVQKEALAGLEAARRNINNEKAMGEAAILAAAQIYADKGVDTKAEELYRGIATNALAAAETRRRARGSLSEAIDAQWWDRAKERIETVRAGIVLAAGFVLAIVAATAIWTRRKKILIHDILAPKDEMSRQVVLRLKYARALMQDPALSPVGVMPASLMANLFVFEDEVDPIEDLELAGAKIPFAALSRIFGEPRVQVTGGYDGVAPLGLAFAQIRARGSKLAALRQKNIRVGTAREQADLDDFAYDVLIRSSSP